MEAAVQSKPFTPFQIEMLEMVSRVSSESEMQDIRRMLGQYFAKRAEDALERLWDEGVINEGVIEEWKHEHMRTPYKQWISFLIPIAWLCRFRDVARIIPFGEISLRGITRCVSHKTIITMFWSKHRSPSLMW